jgi:hypothetical protein
VKLHASGTTATSADVHRVYGNEVKLGGGKLGKLGGGGKLGKLGGGGKLGGAAKLGKLGPKLGKLGKLGDAETGVTWLLDDEKSESKTVLLSLTVNVYAVPFDNPVTTIGDPDPVCEIELGDETTV